MGRKVKLSSPDAAKMIYVIGCGFSGTEYTAKWFQMHGLDIRHERFGHDGIVYWKWTIEDLPKEAIIWHVVRHPLHTISSLTELKPSKWNFIEYHLGRRPEDTPLKKAMLYWHYWNQVAAEKASCTFRVESLISDLKRAGENKTKAEFEWEDLFMEDAELCRRIIRLGESYGYELKEEVEYAAFPNGS